MKFYWIYIIIIFYIFLNTNGLVYNVGVLSTFYNGILPNFNGSIINISSFDPPQINSLSNLAAASLSTYDYIISTYNKWLVILTNQHNIPYLIIPEAVSDITLPPNVFYIPSIIQQTSDATRTLLKQLNASSIVFLDYQPNPQIKNLVAFNNFSQTLIYINESTNFSDIFVNKLQYNAANFYVCAFTLNNTNLIKSLLNEAMLKGQLNHGKVWIFMTGSWTDESFKEFQQFSNIGGTIYSYGVTLNKNVTDLNLNIIQPMVVNDYILMINKSVFGLLGKPSNKSAVLANTVLLNGQLSAYSNFNNVTNQYNGTIINIKRINVATSPVTVFNFLSNLTLTNTNQVTLFLNQSSVPVRIGVMISKGYFMQKPTGEYYGYSVAMLNEFINITNFKYVFVFPTNISNSSYTDYDLLNSLIRFNQADIILIPMVISYITPEAYLSDAVLSMSINMLTRGPDNVVSMLTLIPFTYNVWLATMLAILLLTLGFWAVSGLSPPLVNKNNPKKSESYTFGFSLLVIYSSFVMAKLKVKLLQPSSQIFAFILWFSTLTLVITYAANLLPSLMKTNATYTFSKAQDIVNKLNNTASTQKYVFIKNSVDINIINNDPVLSKILLFNQSVSFQNDNTSETALFTNGAILIQNSNKNSYIYNTLNCSSDMMRGTDILYQMVFAMNNNWKQKEEMKNLIKNLIFSGVADSNAIIYLGNGPCARSAKSNQPSPVPLDVNKLFLLFLLPLGGLLFGVGFAILKLLLTKCCTCIRNGNREPFIMGKIYDAKVSSIDNTGVWAMINQRDRPYYIHTSNLHPDLKRKYTPRELQIKGGDVITLKYFGKDPINGYKRFCKDFSEV